MTNIANNDEIDIRELLGALWKRKFWIIGFVAIVCVATVFIVINMKNVYESKAILRPAQNNAGQISSMSSNIGGLASLAGFDLGNSGIVSPYNTMNALIYDDVFIFSFVKKNGYEKYLIEDYDKVKSEKQYVENERYIINDAVRNSIGFSEDNKTGLISIRIQNKDRQFCKDFIEKFLSELSIRYRLIEMNNLQEKIDNYKNEIDKTSDITLKNKLASVVAGLIQNKIVSQAQQYYGFDILVKPSVPDIMNRVKPKRTVICLAAFFSSFLIAVTGVIVFESFRSGKNV